MRDTDKVNSAHKSLLWTLGLIALMDLTIASGCKIVAHGEDGSTTTIEYEE